MSAFVQKARCEGTSLVPWAPQLPVTKRQLQWNPCLAFVQFERNHIKSTELCLAESRDQESHRIIPLFINRFSFLLCYRDLLLFLCRNLSEISLLGHKCAFFWVKQNMLSPAKFRDTQGWQCSLARTVKEANLRGSGNFPQAWRAIQVIKRMFMFKN